MSGEDTGWQHAGLGKWTRRVDVIDAVVVLDGEIWRSFVYYDGVEVDRAECDSRTVAIRNAWGAIKRARSLRTTSVVEAKREQEDDDDDY